MIVSCPYCSTRYELDTARLTGSTPMLKCSRCRHIFPAPSSKKSIASPRAARKSTADDGSLTLPFEEPVWKDEAEVPLEHILEPEESEDGFTLGTEDAVDERAVTRTAAPTDRKPAPERATASSPATSAIRGRVSEDDGREVDDEEMMTRDDDDQEAVGQATRTARRSRRRHSAASSPPGRSTLVALFIFFGLVLFGYGVLTRALFASPALCDRLIGRLPLIGTLGDDRLLVRKVALSEVTGGYQRIKDGKDVFVITGKAINTAPVALHGVQILGRLYNDGGGTLDTRTIYCGNVISAKVLKDLTPAEVSILQKLSPPKKFVIEPGESSTFVVVFMDPPKQAAQFTAQVVGAQRQA